MFFFFREDELDSLGGFFSRWRNKHPVERFGVPLLLKLASAALGLVFLGQAIRMQLPAWR